MKTTMKIMLMMTSALVAASAAHAQTAPNGTWEIASISNSATNSGIVTLNGSISSTPTIGGGTGSTISGSAVGASGSDTISWTTSGTSAPSESLVVAGTTSLTGTNSGAVTANANVTGASVSGTSNLIAASAVGGVGSLSISSVNSATYPDDASASTMDPVSTNNATYTGAVTIEGANSGAVVLNGNIGSTGATGADIMVGTNSGISASAVGAAGSLSYGNVVTATSADVASSNPLYSTNETVTFTAAVSVTGDNNAGGTVTANTSIFDGTIWAGTGNSISGAAVGASGSLSLSANNGTGSLSNNSVSFGSTVGVTGDNVAAVSLVGDIGSSANLSAESPYVFAGNNNSISLAGVGASGSLSYSGIQTGSLSEENYSVTGVTTVLGTNSGAVTVGTAASLGADNLPGGTGLDADTPVDPAAIYGGMIAAGNGNSISIAAVGGSGSVSLSSVVDDGTPNTTVQFGGLVDIDGTNSGAIALYTQIGNSGESSTKPTILAGNNNAISAAAVGASGSLSYSDVQLSGTASEQYLFDGNVTVNGTNNGGGTVTASGGVYGATISGGNSNSVSLAAVGASGSLSASSLVEFGTADNTVTFGNAAGDTVAVTGTNNAAVTLTGNLGSSSANMAADSPSIAGGTNNSISAAGVGASASISFANTNLSGADGSNNYTISGPATISGDNDATVGVTSTIYGGAISGGTANGISVAAVGSSASFSSTSIVDGAGTAPTTSLSTSTLAIISDNSAGVTLTGSVGAAGAGTDPTISGASTTSASISSAAVGASGSLAVSNFVSGNATPDESVSLGTATFNIDNTGNVTVASGGIYDGTISGGINGSISQAAVGASGSASFANIVDGSSSTLAPGAGEYSIGAQNITVDNTGGAVSITGNIGSSDGSDNASITGGTNNSISIAGVGASGSTSFTSIFTGGASGAGTYSIGAIGTTVTNTGGVTVTANSYNSSISGGTGGSISTAAVGASASTSFTVVVN